MPGLVQTRVFDARTSGPSLLVLCAVHGDGTAGTIALNELMNDIDKGRATLLRGRLVGVPVANPAAYAQKKRLVNANMNRLFAPNLSPANDEERAATEIMPLIDACDVLLDIHSCHVIDRPFAFMDNDTPANRRLTAALGLGYVCTGWNQVYAADNAFAPGPADYAFSKGKTSAFAECGWHDEPAAIAAARQCLRNCLSHLGMLPPPAATPPAPEEIVMTKRILKERPGRLVQDWRNFEAVPKGATVAVYDDGEAITAPSDGCIIFPTPDAALSEAWFYFGGNAGPFR